MSDPTLRALDEAIRAHAADLVNDDETVTSWVVVVAGTQTLDGGGAVITMPDNTSPRWIGKGLFLTALDDLRRQDQGDAP